MMQRKRLLKYGRGGALSNGQKILALNPLQALLLNETSGTTAFDSSGNGRTGTYSGVTLNAGTFVKGGAAGSWDGVNDELDISSASLIAAFPAAVGSLVTWIQVPPAGWIVGTTRVEARFEADANNVYQLDTLGASRSLRFVHVAGGTAKVISDNTLTNSTNWMYLAMTWDKPNDRFRAYLNGAQTGATQTGLGTWAGALAFARIGYGNGVGSYWLGSVASYALFNYELTAAQVLSLA